MEQHNVEYKNILLADIFYKCGYIESWGRGTLKIVKECKLAKLPEPGFYEDNGVITISIYNNAGDNLIVAAKSILEHIKENPKISTALLAKVLNIHVRNVEKNIARLKALEIIERIGSPKSGYWKIK